jgi:hypothetical protein
LQQFWNFAWHAARHVLAQITIQDYLSTVYLFSSRIPSAVFGHPIQSSVARPVFPDGRSAKARHDLGSYGEKLLMMARAEGSFPQYIIHVA